MNKAIFFLSFFVLLFLSSFIFAYPVNNFFMLNLTNASQKDGLAVSIFIFILFLLTFNQKSISVSREVFFQICFYVVVYFFFGMFSVFQFQEEIDLERAFLSFIFLATMTLSSVFFVNLTKEINSSFFSVSVNIFYFLLLVDGLSSSCKYLLFGSKSLLFFREPSHFALVFLPFLGYVCYNSSGKILFFHILTILFIVFSLKNSTLLVGILLILLSLFGKQAKSVFTIVSSLLIFLYSLREFIDVDYFTKRFFLDTENISSLSFKAGWEAAYSSFVNSYGFGVGFQQLGIVQTASGFSRQLLESFGLDLLNMYDASSLSPKLIAELGFFGGWILCLYCYYFFITLKILIRREDLSRKDVFFSYIFVSFVIDLFIRGTGYLSVATFMFFSSVYWLYEKERDRRSSIKI